MKAIGNENDVKSLDELNTKTVLYSQTGDMNNDLPEEEAAAKVLYMTSGNRYYIKVSGSNKRPLNPRSDDILKANTKKVGYRQFTFTEVPERTFSDYLSFLITHNDYEYRKVAQRLSHG